jgi:hypothetical protein
MHILGAGPVEGWSYFGSLLILIATRQIGSRMLIRPKGVTQVIMDCFVLHTRMSTTKALAYIST